MGSAWRDTISSMAIDHFLELETSFFDVESACLFPCQYVPCPSSAEAEVEDEKEGEREEGERGEGEREGEEEEREKAISLDPNFEPNEYIGKYYDRGYGEFNVYNEEGTLFASLNGGVSLFNLSHITGDHFLTVGADLLVVQVTFVRISL